MTDDVIGRLGRRVILAGAAGAWLFGCEATPAPRPAPARDEPPREYAISSAAPYVPSPPDDAEPRSTPRPKPCAAPRPLCVYEGRLMCSPGPDGCEHCVCR